MASSLSRLFRWRRSLRRDLVISTVDAVAYCVMVGCGEMYLGAFVLALGLGPLVAGLVASVPLLVGAVVQLAALLAVRHVGGKRPWVVICTTVQALSLLPLAWWGWPGWRPRRRGPPGWPRWCRSG